MFSFNCNHFQYFDVFNTRFVCAYSSRKKYVSTTPCSIMPPRVKLFPYLCILCGMDSMPWNSPACYKQLWHFARNQQFSAQTLQTYLFDWHLGFSLLDFQHFLPNSEQLTKSLCQIHCLHIKTHLHKVRNVCTQSMWLLCFSSNIWFSFNIKF